MEENHQLNTLSFNLSTESFRAESDLWRELVSLGFNENMIEAVFYFYHIRDLNSALLLLIKSDEGYMHIFLPKEDNPQLCVICDEKLDSHSPNPLDLSQVRSSDISRINSISNVEISKIQIECSTKASELICRVCYISHEAETMLTFPCGHEFCSECVKGYLYHEIKEGRVLNIRCCQAECEGIFEDSVLECILDKSLYEKYLKFKRNKVVESDPNSRWCPNPNCAQVIIREDFFTDYLKCKICSTEVCFQCKDRWHPGLLCEEAVDRAYEEYAKGKDIQRCPKCKVRVEKESGCNHMTCSMCDYQWCWLCRRKYKKSHYDVFNIFGCPGLLDGTNTAHGWGWQMRLGRKLCVFILLLFMIPFSKSYVVILFWFPSFITYQLYEKLKDRRNRWKYCILIWGFLGGILLTPIAYAVLVIFLPILGVKYLHKHLKGQDNDV
jgi:hypothetical protein